MQARYGSYRFAANSCHNGIKRSYDLNGAGIPYIEKIEVDCEGYLTGSTQAALAAAEIALVAAMIEPFFDFALARDDGGRSGIYLRNATSLSGVRVTAGPSFTSKAGAEYANQRTFHFTVAADYPIVSEDTRYISFKERMDYSGGGPEYDYKDAINGDSQLQQLWFRKPYVLVQSGEAYGFLDYPPYPPAAFPTALIRSPDVGRIGADRTGRKYKNFGIRWTYTMKSNSPLIAVPTLWR